MVRPITMFTGQWADEKLDPLAQKMKGFGFDGLEIACWGDHFEVDKAITYDDYCSKKRAVLDKYSLQCHAISAHLVGQAVLDNIDTRHQAILPPHIWGDGSPAGVNQRASEEMKNTAEAEMPLGPFKTQGIVIEKSRR